MKGMRPLFKFGKYSFGVTLPISWLKYIKAKFGFMPKSVTFLEQGDDLVIKAVKAEDKEVKG